MDNNTPIATPDGPNVPHHAAPQPTPPPTIPAGPQPAGAVTQPPAAPPRRNRNPRGPVPASSSSSAPSAPAMLELAAALPMYTSQRRAVNAFTPDAQILFHVLGLCDQMMLSTDRFIRSSPAWIPIVSQLYVSVLWFVAILRVHVNSGYGALHASILSDLINYIRVDECLIPGPLVPFFQALGAINGPFDWIGDIIPVIPDFLAMWNADDFCPNNNFARTLPIPALMLDQLHYFATWVAPAQQALYTNFLWYNNVFSADINTHNRLNRVGPQMCGSLYAPRTQVESANTFWSAALESGITRTNQAAPNPAFNSYAQLLGFVSQTGSLQLDWFQQVALVMQKYCQYFNGSTPLKSISPVGIGAVAVTGTPRASGAVRNWLYPTTANIAPFLSSRFPPRREVPDQLSVNFSHADHELEEQAEQYAILTHTNMQWFPSAPHQNDWPEVNPAAIHSGSYWSMMAYRSSPNVSLKTQFAHLIASRYHQQAANRVD